MDTRPWRLDLPPGVAWFEIDRHDVLKAKKAVLRKHRVKFKPSHGDSSKGNTHSTEGNAAGVSAKQKQGASGAPGSACCELKAASWACATADLQVSGWSKRLQRAGFDVKQPTVWVAEGLMYYLEPECIAALLQVGADTICSMPPR